MQSPVPEQSLTIYPDRAEFIAHAREGWRFPICGEMPLGALTPIDLYARIRNGGEGFILESGKDHRFSYIGITPRFVWRGRGDRSEITGGETCAYDGDPFDALREELERTRIVSNSRLEKFSGGLVGYLAYDMARHIERLPTIAADDLDLPDSCFLAVDRFYEIDHHAGLLRIVHLSDITGASLDAQYDAALEEIEMMRRAATAAEPRPEPAQSSVVEAGPRANLTPDEFAAIVRRAKEYIEAGDIFQVNLSVRFARELGADPFTLYRRLRAINPAPYMSFIELPELAIVSASPELLLRVSGRTLETRPIAGTRPRGASEQEDEANARELIENEKERAEHLMLVDLERNDIGRVARYGSVEVNEFMAIERYSHVIHIVSNVRGELAEGKSVFDAIRACFPGGTITGAPKVRSMEIIEELEPCRRGIYTGSIGWIGYNGDTELNIAIRTILVKDGVAYMQAGAGIVADSVPELEYLESARKAEAALAAVRAVNVAGEPTPIERSEAESTRP